MTTATSSLVAFSEPPIATPQGARYELTLEPHRRWELTLRVSFPAAVGEASLPVAGFGTELEHVREALRGWSLRVPRLKTNAVDLGRSYERSIADLASLRLRGLDGISALPAAGMPWFMTVFGRDTLITSLQTLVFGPELAVGAMRALAALQATEDVAALDAEPGKILHELRRGKAATAWFAVYYGSLDATPLFLVLLSELWRWTGDDAIVLELKDAALAALSWMEQHGDRDGDGFLEYERRTPRGLENQSWKDSGNSQRFADGRLALPPIAPVEVQGYAYDARRRTAELARVVWNEPVLADRLDTAADELARAVRAGVLDRRASGVRPRARRLEAAGRRALLEHRTPALVGHRACRPSIGRGRGAHGRGAVVRLGRADDGRRRRGIQPAQLPQRHGLAARHGARSLGARAGRLLEEGRLLAQSLIEASASFDYSLPEVFAGFARPETVFPIAYPTAARPQAWAAGAPVLCLTLLLGLRPDPETRRLVSDAPSPPPQWLVGTTLDGVRAFGETWTVLVGADEISVTPGPKA